MPTGPYGISVPEDSSHRRQQQQQQPQQPQQQPQTFFVPGSFPQQLPPQLPPQPFPQKKVRGILRKPGGFQQRRASVKFLLQRRRSSHRSSLCESIVTRPNESLSSGSSAFCSPRNNNNNKQSAAAAVGGGRKKIANPPLVRRKRLAASSVFEEMVARTAPGPLSIALYIFLWVVALSVGAIYGSREWRLAAAWRAVRPLETLLRPVSCEPERSNSGEIVHIDCPLRNLETFRPPPEFSWNVKPFTGLSFETRVEMYQWALRPEFLGVRFDGVWSQDVLGRRGGRGASLGLYDTHMNPDYIPRVPGVGRQFVRTLMGGGFHLPRRHLPDFRRMRQLPLVDDKYYQPAQERPPTTIDYRNTQVHNDALYTGDPNAPQVGDIRVTFWGSATTHVSAIGEQHTGAWGDASIGPAAGGLQLLSEGDHRPGEMVREFKRRKGGSEAVRWTLRVSAWIILATLLAFTHRLVDRYGHTRLGPFVLGSLAVGAGLQCLGLSALWLTVEHWRGLLLGLAAAGCLTLGTLSWRWGKSLLAPWEVASSSPPNNGDFFAKQAPLLGIGTERPQHFYQAI